MGHRVSLVNILVVDDDASMRQLISVILDDPKYHLRFAHSGSDAIIEMQADTPDLLIVDMMLPDCDGYTLYHRLREKGYGGPILVCTARDRRESLVERVVSELGDKAVLFKPFDPDELVRRVDESIDPESNFQPD